MLKNGTQAPAFALPDQNGTVHTLDQYRGKKVILFFYSKDNTSGCTKQACGYVGFYPQITEKGAVVLGISKDTVESHKRFADKHALPFPILADPDHIVLEAYDVWKEKRYAGKVTMGTVRATYLIDEEGIICDARSKVKPDEDPVRALEALG